MSIEEENVGADILGLIDETDLENEMTKTPSLYGRYCDLYVAASKIEKITKVQADALKARLLLHYKVQGGSTEAGYKAMVECDDSYVEARMMVVEAESRSMSLDHKLKALTQKLKQLGNVANRINTEMRSNPLAFAQSTFDQAKKVLPTDQ